MSLGDILLLLFYVRKGFTKVTGLFSLRFVGIQAMWFLSHGVGFGSYQTMFWLLLPGSATIAPAHLTGGTPLQFRGFAAWLVFTFLLCEQEEDVPLPIELAHRGKGIR